MSKLGGRLQDLAKESPDDETWRALSYACNYVMNGLGRDFAYGPYGPRCVFLEGEQTVSVFPAPLGRVESDMLDVWASCANDEALHPIPRARLADLLWVRKHGDTGKWINVAVDGYMAGAAMLEVHIVERGKMLARAVAICQESNNQDPRRRETALTALAELAQKVVNSTRDSFGVVGRALIALIDAGHPCEEILTAAMRKYDGNPNRASDLRVLAMKASPDKADRQRLQAERIKAFEDAADQVDGLLRVSLLENARSVASSTGNSKEVDRLNELIQRTDINSDVESVEVSHTFDAETLQGLAEAIAGDDTLSDALDRFADGLTPDLSDERMEKLLTENFDVAPFQALSGLMRITQDGLVVSLPSGSEERKLADIGYERAFLIPAVVAPAGHEPLRSLDKRYGMCEPNLVACFSGPVMPKAAVDKIVLAHRHFQAGDHHSAVAVLWPAIEQIMRSICLAHGLPIASRETSSYPRTRSLGKMLEDLADHINEKYAVYLDAALVDEWALNLRNLYAHGHPADMDDSMAYVILFHIVCVLRVISTPPQVVA